MKWVIRKGYNLHGQNCVPNAITQTKFTCNLCALSTIKQYKGQLYMIHNLCIYQLYNSNTNAMHTNTIEPAYNDIGLCETLSTVSNILQYQLVPHC
jgi:hypothetical protein